MADSKLSELTTASGLTSSDLMYVVQGATSKKIAVSSLVSSVAAFINLSSTLTNYPTNANLTSTLINYALSSTVVNLSSVAQHILPAADVTYDLGSPSRAWRSIYVSGSTIYLGGTNLSVSGGGLVIGTSVLITNVNAATQLSSSLTSYTTNANLTSTLASYATNANLTSTLASYATNANLTSTLNSYTTNANLTSTLASYASSSNLNTLSSNVWKIATTSALGLIRPDGTSITINSSTGIISSTGGGGSSGTVLLTNGAIYKDTSGNAIALGKNSGSISQQADAVSIGESAGYNSQGTNAIAIGYGSGNVNQSSNAIAIGYNAGLNNQNNNAIAIGRNAATSAQCSNSIVINATGNNLQAVAVSSVVIKPMRNIAYGGGTGGANTNLVFYNANSGEVAYQDAVASTGQYGIVKPDGTSITVGGSGLLSVIGGGGGGGGASFSSNVIAAFDALPYQYYAIDASGYKSVRLRGYFGDGSNTVQPQIKIYNDITLLTGPSTGWGRWWRGSGSGFSASDYAPNLASVGLYWGMNSGATLGWFELELNGWGTDIIHISTKTVSNTSSLPMQGWEGYYTNNNTGNLYFSFENTVGSIYKVAAIGYK